LTGDAVTGGDTNSTMHGNLCYSIDSNAWWLWAHEHGFSSGATGLAKIYTCVTYTGSTVIRVCFIDIQRDAATAFSYGLHPRLAYPYQETTVGTGYYDSFNLNNDSQVDSFRIPVQISTNVLDFSNENRKFLRSVRIVGDHIKDYTSVSSPVSAFNTEGLTLNLGYTRDDGVTATTGPTIKRAKALRTYNEHRYQFNNFGAMRRCRFWVTINTYVPVRLEALELTIAQGTH